MGHPSRLGLIDSQEPIERDHPLNAGLVAWWLGLDGNWGGSTLHDLCGKYPGTLTNGPTWSPGPGGFAGLTLDGSNDYVSTPSISLAGASQSFTLSLWLRYTSTAGYISFWDKGSGTNSRPWQFFFNQDSGKYLRFQQYNGTLNPRADTTAVSNDGNWHLFTAVRDCENSQMYIYIDGVNRTTAQNNVGFTTNFDDTSTTVIGQPRNGIVNYFNGRFGGAWAHSRALPAADVYALYEQSLKGHPDTLRRYSAAAWFASPPASSGAEGTLTATLAAPTLSAAGTVTVAGSATPTLAAPTPASAGTVAVVGASSPTLTVPASTAAGTVAVVGTLSATLAAPTLTAAGTSGSVGTATITLAAPTSTAAGTVAVAGEATPTLTAPTPSAAGTVAVAGSATPALAVPTLASAGTVSLSGSAGVALDLPALAAAGAVAVTAELAAALAGYTLSAAGTVAESSGLTATLAVTLDGPALLAAGRGRRRAFDPAGDMALFDADRSQIDPSSDMDYFD